MPNLGEYVKACNKLATDWNKRKAKFKEWYDQLSMKDELEQENMESFVGNDPRSQYNLATQLLTSRPIPHKIKLEGLDEKYFAAAGELELFINNTAWPAVEETYRARGRQNWLVDLVGLLLATGWFSVFAYLSDEGCVAELWNPASVYPEWGDSGLVRCPHIYSISNAALRHKAALRGWDVKQIMRVAGSSNLYDYFFMDGADVVHTIFTPQGFLLAPEIDPNFTSIPVFTSPVGGLPDDGAIKGGDDYRKTIGQSFLAANENIVRSYNKQWTFAQQMLRDTAQPRWFEQSRGGTPIMRKEDVFKRGAIFRGTPEDKLSVLPVPPMPVELRSDRLDMEAMLQRGGLPWALFGTVGQQMTAYVMAQVASSAEQIIGPFHKALIGLLSDIDNHWLDMMRRKGYQPYGFKLPKLPDDLKMSADYEIEIPGSVIQKATVSRMLDPNFRLSTTTTMQMLWPEIKNPIQEQARARKDTAEQHPIAAAISLISFFKKEAARMEKAAPGSEDAELYRKAAAAVEASITPPPAEAEEAPPARRPTEAGLGAGTRGPQRPAIGMRTEAAPPSELEAPIA